MGLVDHSPPPLISVVIPARDAAPTLPAQLDALTHQDFTGPWEVVVVDSASTDGTAAVARGWQPRLPHLRVVTARVAGASRARNVGVRSTAGALVLLCDADDVVAPGWVATMAGALEAADLVGGPLEFELLNRPSVPRPDVTIDAELPIVFGMPYAVSANIGFRRDLFDALGGFDESIDVGEDMDFGWRAHRAGFTLGTAPGAVVHYRLRGDLRAFLRQQYRYAGGHAHVYAKHVWIGNLPRRTARRQLRAFAGDLLDLVRRLGGVGDRQGRWELLGRTAWVAGAAAATLRYGVYV